MVKIFCEKIFDLILKKEMKVKLKKKNENKNKKIKGKRLQLSSSFVQNMKNIMKKTVKMIVIAFDPSFFPLLLFVVIANGLQ